jgi:UDP-glucose 4-epimerase
MANPHSVSGHALMVTGGAGFIGSHLVAELVARGAARVVVVDSLRYGDRANLHGLSDRVELVQHTLGFDAPDVLERAMQGVDYLFHFAAEKHNQSKDDPLRVMQANVNGAYTLYDVACRSGVKKIVFASSLYAYGRMQGPPLVESELPRPRTVYGVTKLAGEHLLDYFRERAGVEFNVLRYFFVYGPKQFAGMGYKSVIVKNFERLLAGERPIVYGDGRQALDYVYVDDAVDAALRALETELTGEVFNVGSGVATTVDELVSLMLEVSGARLEKLYEPRDWTAGSCRVADVEKAVRLLGWRVATPLLEGLNRTYAWLASQRG